MLHKYNRQSRILNHLRAGLIGGSCLGLVSCAMHQDQKDYVEDVRGSHKSPLASLNANKKLHPAVAQAIGLMKDNQFQEASSFLNQALQNEPQSISLHLLNALVYEKLAEVGDSSRIDLAAVGYQNALNLDPNNLFAMAQLGKIKFKNKQYDQAQELFANALLVKPNDASLLQELAASSYYAYDAKTALAAIDQAIKIDPKNPLAHRSAAMIHAALGDMDIARQHQSEYQKLAKNDPDNDKIASRLEDWEFLYKSGRIKLAASGGPGSGGSSSGGPGSGSNPRPSINQNQDDQSDQTTSHMDPDYGVNALASAPVNQGDGG
ncbi:Putative PEP-CTERM system TPR-repeat lipoprotein [Candidatus Bealeia paramacronuclearis]|uniref:PEP-CTERM system TPR-repeat lipoprotein n=1 Tax=Candidatus Bealeia paramacronuclearis TaxID=1921001 RepID=A0ABZ2C1A2_9PROT|nr:putative PEP-CTERM system TPR-repeat lipoprotein [Candidatus Bealeia paramacronuclearis]